LASAISRKVKKQKMLEIKSLVAAYGQITALHGLDISIKKYSIVAVLGGNGAGKTTLLKCISGLLRPKSGEIKFDGESLVGKEPEKIVAHGISHVPEGRLIFPSLTVKENLIMGGYLGSRHQTISGIERVCAYFPILAEKLNQQGGTLSGGEQQMLSIARALVLTPKVLLLDEPSMGVAPVIKDLIFEKLLEIHNHEKTTIVLVEQDAELALSVCQYAYVLETGRSVLEGTNEKLNDNEDLIRVYLGG
jgi:branched-chain amino acid transport system ATP-binding protein